MAWGTTAVAHTTSKVSPDVRSVKDWDAAQGSVGKHLWLLSDVKGWGQRQLPFWLCDLSQGAVPLTDLVLKQLSKEPLISQGQNHHPPEEAP